MTEVLILLLFALALLGCVTTGRSVILALVLGLLLFSGYGLRRGHPLSSIAKNIISSVRKVKNVLAVFICIGMQTAIWRACGTIPYIVSKAIPLIVPQHYVFCVFALCCVFSYITGTSFGTVSTLGAICMILGSTVNIPSLPLAGAILAGSFFGDRCSPMSSSALLTAQITGTEIYTNVKIMFRTAAVPLMCSCFGYLLLGNDNHEFVAIDALAVFEESFALHWSASIPALVIIFACILRIEVKHAMLMSTAIGMLLCLLLQKMSILDVMQTLLLGFQAEDNPQLQSFLGGGGLISMVNVTAIICISSSFSGLFQETGLLDGLSEMVRKLAIKIGKRGTCVAVSAATCMVSCNQTLALLLTDQLVCNICKEPVKRASWLEDTVIIMAPLVPWSIASAVPLAILDAPYASTAYAFYLYLIPMWFLVKGIFSKYCRGDRI